MDILKKIFIFALVIIISYLVAPFFGHVYDFIFSPSFGGMFALTKEAGLFIAGIFLAYIFLITFLYTALTKKHRYWWIGIPLLPVLYIEIVSDLLHIYFPIIIGLIGWGLGLLVFKLRNKQ